MGAYVRFLRFYVRLPKFYVRSPVSRHGSSQK